MSRFVRRNDPCPCGSGKKHKKCCLNKEDNPDFSNIANLPNIYKDGRKHSRFKECTIIPMLQSSLSGAD